jgi:hypothetical protein
MSSTVGRGFAPWEELTADPGAVLDSPVQPLVEALNATGWARTVFSCGGHPEEPDSISRGRRQAHLDVAVSNGAEWKRLTELARRTGDRRLRVTDGGLGRVPEWLQPQLPEGKWDYRRLVFEPVPYAMPPEQCREVLDAALAAAVAALEESRR